MGIALKPLIEATTHVLREFKDTTVAVDGSNMLYQILNNSAQKEQGLEDNVYVDRTQRVIIHLYGWIQKAMHFYRHHIFPIVIFDGRPDPMKRTIPTDAQQRFLQAKDLYQKALAKGDLNLARSYALGSSFMWANCVQESKDLLHACGIPTMDALGEAEAQCVKLQQNKVVDYIVSTDYDVLCYGASKVIRQLTFSTQMNQQTKTPPIKIIDVQANLTTLGINLFQLIDLSIILGNDYYPGIKQIGPKKALETIRQYKTLEAAKAAHPHLFSEISNAKIDHIRQMFLFPNVQELTMIPRLPLDQNKIRQILTQDHHCNQERVERYITKLQECYAKYYKKEIVKPPRIDTNTARFENQSNTSSPFTQAIFLPDDAERQPAKPRRKQGKAVPKILSKILDLGEPQYQNIEEVHPFPQIDDHYRIEVQMTTDEKVVYYLKRNQPFAEWPIEVQMQYRTVIGILYALNLIPDAIYQEKYFPLWQQSPTLEDALENFTMISTDAGRIHN